MIRWLYARARRFKWFRIWDYDRRMRALARRDMISTEHNPRYEDVDADRIMRVWLGAIYRPACAPNPNPKI